MSAGRLVQRRRAPVLPAEALAELRAALASGASPSAAFAAAAGRCTAGGGAGKHETAAMDTVLRQLRAGQPVAEIATGVATGDPAADLLVRALAVAERTGCGALVAVDQAVTAARDEADVDRLLRSRTLQARGTAVMLTAVPVCAWTLLVAADRSALSFYGTPLGAATGGLALALAVAGRWWSRRLVAGAQRAGDRADPLTPQRPPPDRARVAALALPVLVAVGVGVGPLAGVLAGALVAAGAARRSTAVREAGRAPTPDGGRVCAAEAVELVTVALAAGLAAPAAVAAVAPFAQPAARPPLVDAARRLRNGWDAQAAFAGGGLDRLGATLAVSERWGAPAGPELRRLADDLRAVRRAAVEEAAERTQLALVFPTTMLTLPAFLLGVVPPMLWTAFVR